MDKYLLKCFTLATYVLPERIWRGVYTLSDLQKTQVEEIRVRAGRQLAVLVDGKISPITVDGLPLICTKDEVEECVARATKSSVHTYNHQIKQGFVSLNNGCRMGLCGSIIEEEGVVRTMSHISSVNIRVARQIVGIADGLYNQIDWEHKPNVLIISKAGGGKTTMLRDLVRRLSRGGVGVGLADQRYEIAACRDGVPAFEVGDNTDVVSGGEKARAVEILIRTMSPQYIAFDEITAEQDAQCLVNASYMGSGLLATAHCDGVEQLGRRPIYKRLMDSDIFDYIIEIKQNLGQRNYVLHKKGGNENGQANGCGNDYSIVGSPGGLCIQNP